MPIPWDKVILHGPQVLDVAKTLYGKWQSRPKQAESETVASEDLEAQLNSLRSRLKSLEEAGEKQAALAAELAEQTQALSIGVTALKEGMEHLQHEAEKAGTSQANIDARFNELYTRLQQADAANSALNKKIMLALTVSIAALISFAAVVAGMLR